MKQRLQGIIIGIALTIIVGIPITALAQTRTLDAFFNNIKITVNGKQIAPDTEPFVYNARTYVPVRFVAEALGNNVNWNASTNTVEIYNINNNTTSTTPTPSAMSSEISDNIERMYFSYMSPSFKDESTPLGISSYRTTITKNIIGTPELSLVAINSSDKDIVAFEFECTFTDSFGRSVNRTGTTDPIYKGIVQDAKLPKKEAGKSFSEGNNWNVYRFNLTLYNLAVNVDETAIIPTKIKYSDGTTWTLKR